MKTGWNTRDSKLQHRIRPGRPFSVPPDTQKVLSQLQKFHPEKIAVIMAFRSRAPAFFALIKAIRENTFTGHITAGGHFFTVECRKPGPTAGFPS